MTNNNNVKKTQLVCFAMDCEEKGLNLLQVADLYRADSKNAIKSGYATVAANLMAKAAKLAAQGYEYLADAKATQEEADKL